MGQIEFIADTDSFKAIKKLAVEADTEPAHVARFLASVQDTLARKTRDFLAKDFPVEKLDEIAGQACGAELGKHGWALKGRVGEEAIATALARARGPSTTKAINELVKGKKAQELAKDYVLQQTLMILGFPIVLDAKLFEKYLEEKALAD